MHGFGVSTGRLLGSVALRYRQPVCAPAIGPTVVGGMGRFLLSVESSDELPLGGGPFARSAGLARLEAVLFLADHPQASRKLAQLAGLADGTEARTLVRTLNRMYDVQESAFRVEEIAGGFQLMSRSKFAAWLRRLHPTPVEVRLSPPALETLAVVAYRQPVLRADVEAIRGVQCGEMLRQLIERNLVRIAGRSEELGRPFLYGTSKEFLQVFGLRHLDELPRAELMANQPSRPLEAEKEMNVKTLTMKQAVPEELDDDAAATPVQTEQDELLDDDLSHDVDEDEEFDDDDYEEDDEEDDDDEDFDDQTWEEVEDEEDEDWEEDDEEDDDEDEDWEEDWGEEDGPDEHDPK